jgi:hypothetical protein
MILYLSSYTLLDSVGAQGDVLNSIEFPGHSTVVS